MDELLSQLRSTQRPSQASKKEQAGDSMADTSCSGNSIEKRPAENTILAKRPVGNREDDSVPSECAEAILDVTTSQGESQPAGCYRLDFDFLAAHRAADALTVAEAKKTPLYKIEQPLYALVKTVEVIGADVCRWELCDETGTIAGSTCAHEGTAGPGDIVYLSGCSIWKINGNHLNIVNGNIKKIIRK